MASFTYAMPGGIAGDINRTHPFSVIPALPDATNPPTWFGQALLAGSSMATATPNAVRAVLTGDRTTAVDLFGVLVRSYPFQEQSNTNAFAASAFGAGTVPTNGPLEVLRMGYIIVPVVGSPVLGGAVSIWANTASGAHVVGGFEAAASSGNTIDLAVSVAYWNGPSFTDAAGNTVAELALHV